MSQIFFYDVLMVISLFWDTVSTASILPYFTLRGPIRGTPAKKPNNMLNITDCQDFPYQLIVYMTL